MMRVSHNSDRLAGLDFLRAMAIILVFFCHYRPFGSPTWFGSIGKFGWIGVDLFFVLSGYLIGKQLLSELETENRISFKKFYMKRFFRIIPAYLAVLILYYNLPEFSEAGAMAPAWRFLTFTHNLSLDIRDSEAFSHSWSLCVEEHFYLLLPVIIFLVSYYNLRSKTIYFFLIIFITGFVLRLVNWFIFVEPLLNAGPKNTGMRPIIAILKYIYYPTPTRLEGLLIGFVIAAIFQYKPKMVSFISAKKHLFTVGGFLLLAVCYFLSAEAFTVNAQVTCYSVLAVAFGMLVTSAIVEGSLFSKVGYAFFSFISTISYSFYLIHRQVIHLVQDNLSFLGLPLESNIMFFTCFGAATLAAMGLYWTIEKPFLLLRNKILRSHATALKSQNISG